MPDFTLRMDATADEPAGIYQAGELVATKVELSHAGFYIDDLALADTDVLANVVQALRRRHAPLQQKAIVYEADGDVLWA